MTKTFDISDDLKAIENRGRELRTKQTIAIGETVIATGAEKKLTANQLAGLLLDALERAKTDPAVKKKWEETGEAFFRRKSAAGNGAANRKNGGGDASTSKQVKPPRGAPPPTSEAPDLLTRAQTE
jgi:hypothetical protein